MYVDAGRHHGDNNIRSLTQSQNFSIIHRIQYYYSKLLELQETTKGSTTNSLCFSLSQSHTDFTQINPDGQCKFSGEGGRESFMEIPNSCVVNGSVKFCFMLPDITKKYVH